MNVSAKFKPEEKEIRLIDISKKSEENNKLVIKFIDQTTYESWKEAMTNARASRWPAEATKKVTQTDT